jgi:CheY-like chemotaxis protein
MADRSQLEQVVMNLAINASDVMDPGGRLTIATAGVHTDGDLVGLVPGDYVRLKVTDTGSGMDASTQAQIFEPFFTTKPEGKGTGLGLSTVFGIVTQSEGAITVDSRLDRGTTFVVYLPRGTELPAAAGEARLGEAEGVGAGSVLVVEDDDAVRSLVRGVLEPAGYTVRVAPAPDEALAGADANLLITDMRMPGMNGRELAALILARAPGTRVLYISGYTGEDLTPLEDGARFLAKPFTPNELLEQVRELLSS